MGKVDLTKFVKSVDNIQKLTDTPTPGQMTPQQLKETWDRAGMDIKDFLNNSLIPEIEKSLEEVITTDDDRLNNSRKCDNTFDNSVTARENLKIKIGTKLPETVEEDCIFFLY